jgi:hypothetical protein
MVRDQDQANEVFQAITMVPLVLCHRDADESTVSVHRAICHCGSATSRTESIAEGAEEQEEQGGCCVESPRHEPRRAADP